MAIELTKPWRALTLESAHALPGQLGVYELAGGDGVVVLIGYAGGRSLFGLRGELETHATAPPFGATQFRVEVNAQYLTRFQELLMAHRARYGSLPAGNAGYRGRLGRLTIT
jgi:hypothetical protein